MTPVEALCAAMSGLPGVTLARSRFGSRKNVAWRIDGREFAHLHSESLLDLRLPRAVQARLRDDPRAHFRKRPSEWLELEFRAPCDVTDLVALAQQAAGLRAQGKRPA